mgnify:FL=1
MLYAGVDIGGTNVKLGLVDSDGAIVAKSMFKTDPGLDCFAVVDEILKHLKRLTDSVHTDMRSLGGIGIGIPGVADTERGIVVAAANVGWYNVELARDVERKSGLRCVIGNDANCAALGEQRFGGGKAYRNIVFITLGTGVGSGIVIDGKLFAGMGSAGAEAGHMTLIYEGEMCNCGKRGCWERYASATALIMQTNDAIDRNPDSYLAYLARKQGKVSGRTAFEASEHGDRVAMQVVEQYIRYIAEGLISLGNILHPQAFVIGGGISHEGDKLMRPLCEYVNAYLDKSGFRPAIDVVRATLGNGAGTVGAAALVM